MMQNNYYQQQQQQDEDHSHSHQQQHQLLQHRQRPTPTTVSPFVGTTNSTSTSNSSSTSAYTSSSYGGGGVSTLGQQQPTTTTFVPRQPQQQSSPMLSQQQQRPIQQQPITSGLNKNTTMNSSTTTSTSNTSKMKNQLRTRDIIAFFVAVLVTKMTFQHHHNQRDSNSNNNNRRSSGGYLSGRMSLQWYVPRFPSVSLSSSTSTTTEQQQQQKQQPNRGRGRGSTISNEKLSQQVATANVAGSSSMSSTLPTLLDLDGDGETEVLVTLTQSIHDDDTDKYHQWQIQILDLRPIMVSSVSSSISSSKSSSSKQQQQQQPKLSSSSSLPLFYRPDVLLESEYISEKINYETEETVNQHKEHYDRGHHMHHQDHLEENNVFHFNMSTIVPIDSLSTHVLIVPSLLSNTGKTTGTGGTTTTTTPAIDRTLQFFCGTDWHDASQKCQIHCPSGQSTDCPNNEKCYADTPCTNKLPQTDTINDTVEDTTKTFTPHGGIPGIFTLWSNGVITMHSIIVVPTSSSSSSTTLDVTKQKQQQKNIMNSNYNDMEMVAKEKLKVDLTWQVKIPFDDDNNNNNDDKKKKQEPEQQDTNIKNMNILKLVYDYDAWRDVTIQYVDGLNANNGMGLILVMGHTLIMSYPPILSKQEEDELRIKKQKQREQQQRMKKEQREQQQQQQHNNNNNNNILDHEEYGGGGNDDDIYLNHDDDDYISNRKAYHVHFVLAINVEDGTILWNTVTGMEDHYNNMNNNYNNIDYSSNNSNGGGLLGDPLTDTILSRGAQSVARRRSRIPGLSDVPTRGGLFFKVIDSGPELSYHHHHGHDMNHNGYRRTNCLRDYRYSLLTSSSTSDEEDGDNQSSDHVLPHMYYSEEDARMDVVHFEHQTKPTKKISSTHNKKKKKRKNRKSNVVHQQKSLTTSQSRTLSSWSLFSSNRKDTTSKTTPSTSPTPNWYRFGRPNVVVLHNRDGIQVRALKNGRFLCHLTLSDNVVYTDVNHDGTLDSIQNVVYDEESTKYLLDSTNHDHHEEEEDDKYEDPFDSVGVIDGALENDATKWVQQLAERLQKPPTPTGKKKNKYKKGKNKYKKYQQNESEQQAKLETGGEGEGDDVSSSTTTSSKSFTPLCHMLALSGIPTKEELFAIDLCGGRKNQKQKQYKQNMNNDNGGGTGGILLPNRSFLSSSPPLVVEPLLHLSTSTSTKNQNSYDIITAVNTGMITRVRGTTGRIMWQKSIVNPVTKMFAKWYGSSSTMTKEENDYLQYLGIPDWVDPEVEALQRIEVRNVQIDGYNTKSSRSSTNGSGRNRGGATPPTASSSSSSSYSTSSLSAPYRPVLWNGQHSMVMFTTDHGNVLAGTLFPQPITNRPYVVDFNGDGTSDVIVMTEDGIWGYQIQIKSSSTIVVQFFWSLFFVLFLIAIVRNQFQYQPGQRSSDPPPQQHNPTSRRIPSSNNKEPIHYR